MDQWQSLIEAIFSDDSYRANLENALNQRRIGDPDTPLDPKLDPMTVTREHALSHAIKDWLESHQLGTVKHS